jgi:glucosylceramidase
MILKFNDTPFSSRKFPNLVWVSVIMLSFMSCQQSNTMKIEVFETSAAGNQLNSLNDFPAQKTANQIIIHPEETFQEILGFGGSFTEASGYVLNQISKENRVKILEAYFSKEGAHYSLTRTHINSCDFSLGQYAYSDDPNDLQLEKFSIEPDRDDIIPMILDAKAISPDGFKIISSPWTAPPYMKDNNDWVGGKLLPEYYDTWALYYAKYIQAYREEGIDIWGITVVNEPLGNDNNWESMHFTAQEMTDFVKNHLGPKMEAEGLDDVKILGYDQNRDHLKAWVDVMYADAASAKYFDGTAIHWYASTFEVFPEALQYAHQKAPDDYLIQTEACIDAQVPVWQDDSWYWKKEATDWGWTWASEENKHLHPKYVPVYRYAGDIIGCLNNWVNGWIDWNMVLDTQGGPNWAENWCIAPVIVDTEKNEVYLTPLYYVMAHFSKFIRPGAKRIGWQSTDKELLITAAQNPDGSIAVVVLNQAQEVKYFNLEMKEFKKTITIDGQALQTIILNPN